MRYGFLVRVLPVLLLGAFLVLACSSSDPGPASDGDTPDGDITDGDTQDGDLEDGDGPDGDLEDGDTPDPEPIFEHEIFTHTPAPQSGIATGNYELPALAYPPIPLDPAFTHVLSFQTTPWAFPLRAPDLGNGPLILFTDDLETIVFSPMDHFFVSLLTVGDDQIEHGIIGDVEEIPENFTHRFILVRGQGINATVAEWGRLLMADRGIGPRDRYADTGVSTIGYWTDNGSAYFYKEIPGKNFEDTLLAVKEEADELGIPYGYFQIDSQWYYRGPDSTVRKGGLYKWEPNPAYFPDGLPAFRERLGLPLIAHNKWFELDNSYVDDYTFINGQAWALPLGREIYDRFMADAVSWGIETYEPDWLMSHIWEFPYLRQNVHNAEIWMDEQHDAAFDAGLTMQLCMAGAAHLMYTLDMPAVTSFRTSIDYHAATSKESYWPMFHTVNMLAGALGIMPFKDNFHSSETWGEQEAQISILSAGMVGVGDAIAVAKPEILLSTCRKDGILLKPDYPATPIDPMFLPHTRPHSTSTYSDRGDIGRWTYFSAYHLARNHPDMSAIDRAFAMLTYDGRDLGEMFVWPEAISDWNVDLKRDLGISGAMVLYNWRTQDAQVVQDRFTIPEMPELYDYAYFVLAPVFANGLALLGEVDKFVTLADARFAEIEVLDESVRVALSGAPGEVVVLRLYDADAQALLAPVTVTIGENGQATATLGR